MWYIILYYLIFVQQFVITLASRYRPVIGMTNYRQESLDAVYPVQPVQSNFNQNNGNYDMLRQSNNMHQPIQPLIKMSYQIRKQPQFKMPEQLPLRYSVQKSPILPPVLASINIPNRPPSKTSMLMELYAPNQMTVQQLDYKYLQQETWPTVTTTSPTTTKTVSVKRAVKRIRKSKLRNNTTPKKKPSTLRILKMSSSTRPPYPGGIRPETKEVDGDYILCDGNAICHKYVWTTKKAKTPKKTRR
ncbi:uncharacterized protein LOC111349703 [Spodoptera litura]|uniref:Uncharacterized protein LOC111349703 n=1 Tax=Spodoptera litura TaxID=69820 RepID=A0A9J7IMQ2_SPOLT|nr:uncharacterized protein LOC111349703 [Spodoptera litura]